MIILGIDPGYDRLGVAIVEKIGSKEVLLFSDCLKTKAKDEFVLRLFYLTKEVEKIIKRFKPTVLAIEKLFFTTNQKTAMGVSEVKGAISFVAAKNNLTVLEITPLQVKSSLVGYGKADKTQVATMVEKILKLEKKKRYDDEYDAIALAITGGVLYKNKEFLMPA